MEFWSINLEISILEIYKTILNRDKENLFGQMEDIIKARLKIIKSMVLACTKTISEIIMKENGFKIKYKGMENISGIIKTLILASGRKIVVMVLVLQPPLMKHMRVILNLTYEKVMELAILNKESTKDTGI